MHVMGYLYIYVIARKTSMCARASIYHLAEREETRPSTNAFRGSRYFRNFSIPPLTLSTFLRRPLSVPPLSSTSRISFSRSLSRTRTRMILSYRRLTHNERFLSSKKRNLSILVRISQIRMVRKRK